MLFVRLMYQRDIEKTSKEYLRNRKAGHLTLPRIIPGIPSAFFFLNRQSCLHPLYRLNRICIPIYKESILLSTNPKHEKGYSK